MGDFDARVAKVIRVEVFIPDNGRADANPTTGVQLYQAKDLNDVGYSSE